MYIPDNTALFDDTSFDPLIHKNIPYLSRYTLIGNIRSLLLKVRHLSTIVNRMLLKKGGLLGGKKATINENIGLFFGGNENIILDVDDEEICESYDKIRIIKEYKNKFWKM